MHRMRLMNSFQRMQQLKQYKTGLQISHGGAWGVAPHNSSQAIIGRAHTGATGAVLNVKLASTKLARAVHKASHTVLNTNIRTQIVESSVE